MLAEMLGSALSYWRNRRGYQTFLYAAGTLLFLSGLFHIGVFLVAALQTFGGLGPFDLDVPMTALLSVSAALLLGAFAVALSGLERPRRPLPATAG